MTEQSIVSVVGQVNKHGSALAETTLRALLPLPINPDELRAEISKLEAKGTLQLQNNLLLLDKHAVGNFHKNAECSRKLFDDNRKSLQLLARIPWVRFLGLTGSNAFESCSEKDDIDLFVVCAQNRMWIVYICIFLLGKLLGKRPLFCTNYFVDEAHLQLPQQDYFSAVQFYKMKPLFNAAFKEQLFKANPWIATELPNAEETFTTEAFYRLRADFKPGKTAGFLLNKVNKMLYRIFLKRWTQRYPRHIQKSMRVHIGLAKLHHQDHSKMYENSASET